MAGRQTYQGMLMRFGVLRVRDWAVAAARWGTHMSTEKTASGAELRFCVDCAHFDPVDSECTRKRIVVCSLVTGELHSIPTSTVNASWERYEPGEDHCGEDARFFKAKSVQPKLGRWRRALRCVWGMFAGPSGTGPK